MQEVFEKIIERLKEKRDKYENLADGSNFDGFHEEEIKYLAMEEAYEHAIEIVNKVVEENKNKYVSIGAYKQVAWERDIAIEQLHELGYEFGEKIEEEYCDYNVHFAPSTAIYFTTKCGHSYNGYLNGSRPYCGFCGKKIKVVE